MSITRETIAARLTETLQADDGAGSDLPTGDLDRCGEWLEVLAERGGYPVGNIDIQHLASDVIDLIERAGGEVK